MAQGAQGPSSSHLIRWSALIVIALVIGASLVYLQADSVLALWSGRFAHPHSLFPMRPGLAAIACAAAALVGFCAVMLRPRGSRGKSYDYLAGLLACFMLLAAAYVIAVVRNWPTAPHVLVAAMWIVAAAMFLVAARGAPRYHSQWLRIPFSVTFAVTTLLLLAMLALATASPRLAALPQWLRDDVEVVALGLAGILAAVAALRYHDYVFPAVLGAFVAGIPFASGTRTLALAMWGFSGGMLLLAIVAAILIARDPRESMPGRRRYRGDEPPAPSPMPGRRRNRARAKTGLRRYLIEADSLMRL